VSNDVTRSRQIETEQKPEVHFSRLSVCVGLAGIAYVLGRYAWSWLAATIWAVVVAYALIVAWGIVDALRSRP
jgi:hypothetical protein